MFYPTVEKAGFLEIQDPYYRFLLLADKLEETKKIVLLAKEAFLHAIATKNACEFQKLKVLQKIVARYPAVLDSIRDWEMIEALRQLRDGFLQRGELISTPELEWTAKFLLSAETKEEAECIIYMTLLQGSEHWDKHRRKFKWNISERVRLELIRTAIKDAQLGNRRRTELGREIGEPCEEAERAYFQKLVFDRHYAQARGLALKHNEEDVLWVAGRNLDAGYIDDAQSVITLFLPERQDLVKEIQVIRDILCAN